MLRALTALVFLLTFAPFVWAQGKSVQELAMYKGPDREKMLLEGAKKEGQVVWYTSLSGRSYRKIRDGFAKKYPDIKIDVYRAGSKDLSQKILAEAKSGRYLADAIESTPPILLLLQSRKIIRPYTTPELAKYPEDAKIKAKDGGVYWVTDRESFIGVGYNTNLVPKDKVPSDYDGLLDPFFKDKLMMQISSTGDRVIGTMLKFKGEEYVDKLKEQHVAIHKISSTAARDLIVSGEFFASPTIYRNHALVKINEGAPLGWVPMDVVPTNAGGAALFTNAPHPHAAMLLVDFIIGDEGQEIFQEVYYGVAWKDYPFKRYYPERGMNVRQYNTALKKWNKLLLALGRAK